MKKVICLLQGISDVPLNDLQGMTPLEKAKTPFLDALANQGECYHLQSHTKTLSGKWLDFWNVKNPSQNLSEGYFIARALDCPVEGKVVFLVRFASLGGHSVVDVSDELVSDSEGALLCKSLNERFCERGHTFYPIRKGEALLVTSHPGFEKLLEKQAEEVFFNPLKQIGRDWLEKYYHEKAVKEDLQQMASLLELHEVNRLKEDFEEPIVNGLVLSQGGKVAKDVIPELSSLKLDSHCLLSHTRLSQGIGKEFGIPYFPLPKESQRFSLLPSLLEQVQEGLKSYSCMVIELNYLWRSTYKGDLLEKIKTIEWLDQHFLKPLGEAVLEQEGVFCVTSLYHSDMRSADVIPGKVPCVIARKGKTGTGNKFVETGSHKEMELGDLLSLTH